MIKNVRSIIAYSFKNIFFLLFHKFFRERRIPSEVLRKRELKWLDMFENWEKWMSKRFKKVIMFCIVFFIIISQPSTSLCENFVDVEI